MSIVTVTTEQVHELIQQLAAQTVAASITPEMVANIFEKMRNLNDQEREKVIAVTEAYIARLLNMGISSENIQSLDKEIIIETDEGKLIVRINSEGADFLDIKLAGNQVATTNQIPTRDSSIGSTPSNTHVPTTKAVKEYVDANSVSNFPINNAATSDSEEEFILQNDAGTEQYAKAGTYGIKAPAYRDMQGNNVIPVKDSSIGDNPSNSHVPTTQAVKTYVDNNAGIGNLPISGETTASSDEEFIVGNDNLSQEYFKAGSYGIKAKKYLDMNGKDILDGVGKTIRLLFIGSSFGVDTVSELGNIVQSVGKKIIIGNAYIGAATLDTFISRYRNHQGGIQYFKWFENATSWSLWDGDNEEWLPNAGTGVSDEDRQAAYANTYLDFIIQDDAWDYIILQNGAYQSPYPDQSPFWIKDGQGNITRNIVNEMIAICKKNCLYTNPVFGMNMTWAFSVYHTISSGHLNDDYWVSYGSNQGARQMGMYNNIATNYSDCLVNCEDVKFIIPSGTTIQNARLNSTLRDATNYTEVSGGMPTIAQAEAITSLVDIDQTYPYMDGDKNWKNKNDFTRDSIHAAYIQTRFLLGATLYQKLLSKLYGIDISQSTYRQGYEGSLRPQLATPVTDENFPTLVSIVKASIANPFSVNSNQ